MRIEDLNWMDVEEYLRHDDRLMIILGAIEQHGYLSLATDVRVPQALADAASQKTGVLVAPPLNYGVSPYFMTYPGTFTLRLSTFLDVVEDLVRAAYQHGFRRILVMNGHGGNDPARGRLVEVANALPGLQLAWYAWWTASSVEAVAHKHGLARQHASWMEAFPFTRGAGLPEGEKPEVHVKGILNAEQTRATYGDGVFGSAYQVSPEVMEEVLAACLIDVLYLLDF
jgi:creatinine amidohydrolase